uniref:Uncharacterized protein n=1 Tax=Anguilla anguilla TaxID=7936 RepID=A0A0E9UZS0_ANGAN
MYSFIQLGALMLNKPSATSAGWVLQWIWWTGSWLTRTWSLEPITVAINFVAILSFVGITELPLTIGHQS